MNRENFERVYRRAQFGFRVLDAFSEAGVNTADRVKVLLELYKQRDGKVTRPALRSAVGGPNNSYFSTSVLTPLKRDRYIKTYRSSTKHKFSFIEITSVGEGLVEQVMEALGE